MTANNTPITERLAEAYQKLDAINEIIFAAENAAMACDVVQPTIKMLSDSDIKRIFDLSLHAEYEASRTHPAEGGEGRDYVLVPREPTQAMVDAARRSGFEGQDEHVRQDWSAMLAAAPPPQPVGEGPTLLTIIREESQRYARLSESSMTKWSAREPFRQVSNRLANIATRYALAAQAPERGEAKAVAWQVSYFDKVENAWSDHWTECTERQFYLMNEEHYRDKVRTRALYATPQPPPAPSALRYRDPTIEDAWIAVEHELPPRNTDVLVGRYVNNDWRICQSGYYYDRGNEFEGEKPYWYWSSDWDSGSVTDDEGPTHWMPLPKPAALNAIGAKVEP